jgi:hypothetical protein
MTDQEWQNNFRRMYDLAKYIEQDCEAYNSTNDRKYLESIERDASTVVSIAGLLLEEVAE